MEPQEEHAEHDQNNYVDLVSESHDAIPEQTISHAGCTQSQKKRRRLIPFKYHSKIFKISKKKRHADDNRISTNSSSYASCRTFKKDSGKSNASSHTYHDIEECIHPAGLARCSSIASQSTVSSEAHLMRKFPKKTGRHAKKYMGIFCMILVCAIISAAIASVFSTNSLEENVNKQLSEVEFQTQPLSNVTNEEVKNHIDDLRNEVHNFTIETKIINKNHIGGFPNKRDMEEFLNKTKNIELLLQTLPKKADMAESLDKTMMKIEQLLQTLSNKADKDMEESRNKTKNIELLLQTLPNKADIEDSLDKTRMKIEQLLQTLSNKADFGIFQNGTEEDILKLIHAARCKTECLENDTGDFQSCFTCGGFIKCSHGSLVNQTCAPSSENRTLYWDDFKKKCLFKSRTCDPSYSISDKQK